MGNTVVSLIKIQDWVKFLRTAVKTLKDAHPRLSEDDMTKKLNDVKKIFPEKSMKIVKK